VSADREIDSVLDLLAPSDDGPLMMQVIEGVLRGSIFINLALMAFNLLPIAPLDGSKILHMFIPPRYEHEYEIFMERGPFVLLILIVLGMVVDLPILSGWVFMIMTPFLEIMNAVTSVIG
jgi:Zn-dependent protease